MSDTAFEPRREHMLIVEKRPREPWTSTADKIADAEAKVRAAEALLLDTHDAARDVRHAQTHRPTEPEPVTHNVDDTRSIDPDTADWIVDDWRDHDWRSR